MAVIRLKQYELYQLIEWLKDQAKAKRLDGLDRKVIAARAHQDLRLSVEITEYHIKKVADIANIQWNIPRQYKHIGNSCTIASVAHDLRELSAALVQLMNELGVDKQKPIYQQALKLSTMGGARELKEAA